MSDWNETIQKMQATAAKRLESDAAASVALDAGDTQVEIDYKAAVRDLAAALERALKYAPHNSFTEVSGLAALDTHAAAIAAARSET